MTEYEAHVKTTRCHTLRDLYNKVVRMQERGLKADFGSGYGVSGTDRPSIRVLR